MGGVPSLLCTGERRVARLAAQRPGEPRGHDRRRRGRGRGRTAELEDNGPEGAAADGKGHIFVNNEGKGTIQVDGATFDLDERFVTGPATKVTETARNQLRRRGIRFAVEVHDGAYRPWPELAG